MSSNRKFTKKLERYLEGKGFSHPETEEFVPFIKRTTKGGHLIINCPRDKYGEPFPGREGSTYNVGGTSGDQGSIRIVLSDLRKRGVLESDRMFCGLLMYNSADNICWDPYNDEYDFSTYPKPGDLITPYPQPRLEAQMTGSQGDELLAKYGMYMRAPCLIVPGIEPGPECGWGYDENGELWAHVLPTKSPESVETGTPTAATWIPLDPRDWRWEVNGSDDERIKRDKPL
jgi:hypothetical protein